jgi:hypothetical protein
VAVGAQRSSSETTVPDAGTRKVSVPRVPELLPSTLSQADVLSPVREGSLTMPKPVSVSRGLNIHAPCPMESAHPSIGTRSSVTTPPDAYPLP